MADAFFIFKNWSWSCSWGLTGEVPRAPMTVMLLTGAILEVNPGLQERIFTHTLTHNENFDLAQGSVEKTPPQILWCHNISRFCACFIFLLVAITLSFLLLKLFHMDQKGWLFNVTISTFAVLCDDAFKAHCSVSVDGWYPTVRVWYFEAVFLRSHLFIRESDWIWRTKTTCYRWAATKSVCDQKWFSLRSPGVHGPKTCWNDKDQEKPFFLFLKPTINYFNPYKTFFCSSSRSFFISLC